MWILCKVPFNLCTEIRKSIRIVERWKNTPTRKNWATLFSSSPIANDCTEADTWRTDLCFVNTKCQMAKHGFSWNGVSNEFMEFSTYPSLNISHFFLFCLLPCFPTFYFQFLPERKWKRGPYTILFLTRHHKHILTLAQSKIPIESQKP